MATGTKERTSQTRKLPLDKESVDKQFGKIADNYGRNRRYRDGRDDHYDEPDMKSVSYFANAGNRVFGLSVVMSKANNTFKRAKTAAMGLLAFLTQGQNQHGRESGSRFGRILEAASRYRGGWRKPQSQKTKQMMEDEVQQPENTKSIEDGKQLAEMSRENNPARESMFKPFDQDREISAEEHAKNTFEGMFNSLPDKDELLTQLEANDKNPQKGFVHDGTFEGPEESQSNSGTTLIIPDRLDGIDGKGEEWQMGERGER